MWTLHVLVTQTLPAPSTHHNQPPRPFFTPTSRKGAAGPARRGFPRAGGRGVGAGKRRSTASPCSDAARRRAKGAQRAKSARPTSACARRARRPRPRGRGPCPRTAGVRARRRVGHGCRQKGGGPKAPIRLFRGSRIQKERRTPSRTVVGFCQTLAVFHSGAVGGRSAEFGVMGGRSSPVFQSTTS